MDETVAALATCKQDQRKKTETQSLLTSAHSPVLQAEKKKNESSSGDQIWAYPEPALLQKQHPAGSPMLFPPLQWRLPRRPPAILSLGLMPLRTAFPWPGFVCVTGGTREWLSLLRLSYKTLCSLQAVPAPADGSTATHQPPSWNYPSEPLPDPWPSGTNWEIMGLLV